jgi:geranylgeranyl diphosphate synthase, type II
MHSIASLQKILDEQLPKLIFRGNPPELYDPISYTMNLGGKRIRPLLVLLGCDLFGGDVDTCLRPAAAIEVFHNFTLVHDDIMDKALIRRGKPTVYRKWNPDIAILAGDTMFAMACELLSETDPRILPSLLGLFTKTAREVCEGQQYDMNFEHRSHVSISEYLEMIRLKTAVLLGCSLKFGAILGHAPEADSAEMYAVGENLGLGFQLQDDLLDTFGDEEKFGKEIGGDIVANKKTYLLLKAMETASPAELAELGRCFSAKDLAPEVKIRAVKGVYQKLKIYEKTKEQIDLYFTESLKNLKEADAAESRKEVLRSLIVKIQNRDF